MRAKPAHGFTVGFAEVKKIRLIDFPFGRRAKPSCHSWFSPA